MSAPLASLRLFKLTLSLTCMLACGSLMTGCLALPIPYKGYPHKAIQGVLVDAQSGKPIDDATVRLRYFSVIYGGKWQESTKTNHDGAFILQSEKTIAFPYILSLLSKMSLV